MPEAFDETVEGSLLLDEPRDPIREGFAVGAGLGTQRLARGPELAMVHPDQPGEGGADGHNRNRFLLKREAGPLHARSLVVLTMTRRALGPA